MTADKAKFGEAMRGLRRSRGLTLAEVKEQLAGRNLHYSTQGVSAWERGESAPPADVVRAIEDILDVSRGTLGIHLDLVADDPLSERLLAIEAGLDAQRQERAEIRRLLERIERLLGDPPSS